MKIEERKIENEDVNFDIGINKPTPIKTGTTIVALKYSNGVILAADTRSTSGPVVANKNCFKIHKITENIYACGAGVAADTDRVTSGAGRNLLLFQRKFKTLPTVTHCSRMIRDYLYKNKGNICAALFIGGVDDTGAYLYSISPHGYINSETYSASGSGTYAAIGLLESMFKQNMNKEEAIHVAVQAVKAGIQNDLYSGSNVDICVIEKDSEVVFNVEVKRNHLIVEQRCDNSSPTITYPNESIHILKEDIVLLGDDVEVENLLF